MAKSIETVNETTGEIVSQNGVPVPDDYMRTSTALVNTIHPVTMEERKTAFNALNNAKSLDDMGDKSLNIIGIAQEPGIRTSRDPKVPDAKCTNTTLVAEDGTGYFSQSEGIARSARNLVRAFGANWPEPLTMHVQSNKLANKNTLKTLVLD